MQVSLIQIFTNSYRISGYSFTFRYLCTLKAKEAMQVSLLQIFINSCRISRYSFTVLSVLQRPPFLKRRIGRRRRRLSSLTVALVRATTPRWKLSPNRKRKRQAIVVEGKKRWETTPLLFKTSIPFSNILTKFPNIRIYCYLTPHRHDQRSLLLIGTKYKRLKKALASRMKIWIVWIGIWSNSWEQWVQITVHPNFRFEYPDNRPRNPFLTFL